MLSSLSIWIDFDAIPYVPVSIEFILTKIVHVWGGRMDIVCMYVVSVANGIS